VNYSNGIIKDTEFFTTTELAQKLKMNVQVITRKVQAGEIFAYKIGKDWRIPESSVFDWLEARSNREKKKTAVRTSKVTTKRTPEKPVNQTERKYLLEYILAQFEPNRDYSGNEVDRIISRHHADTARVRREFLEQAMMDKQNDIYRRRTDYNLSR